MQWLIVVAALIGAMLNARGKWQGFVFWLVSNAFWAIHNIRIGEYAQASLYGAFWLLAAYGAIHWRSEHAAWQYMVSKYAGKYSRPVCSKCGLPKRYERSDNQ